MKRLLIMAFVFAFVVSITVVAAPSAMTEVEFVYRTTVPCDVVEEDTTLLSDVYEDFVFDKIYDDNWNFKKEYRLNRYMGRSSHVDVPDTFLGYPVTEISYDAFLNCDTMKSIIIPETVSCIRSQAFYDCDNLVDIIIPDSVEYIEFSTFYGCDNLKNVYFGSKISRIEYGAFTDCKNLSEITFSSNIDNIQENAFFGCKNLTKINFEQDLASWLNISFGNCWSNPLKYGADLYIKNDLLEGYVVIPEGITCIKDNAFVSYDNITCVEIPNSVTTIATDAFAGCDKLKNIIIPESVKKIGNGNFNYCYGLVVYYRGISSENWNKIEIGSGNSCLTSGKRYYLPGRCGNDTKWDFSKGVLTISGKNKTYVFSSPNEYSWYSLKDAITSIVIGNGITEVGEFAFFNYPNVKSVVIPGSLTNIGQSMFQYCISLKSIEIPNGVTSIGDRAFSACQSLERVIIGNGVENIGNGAFYNCDNIKSIDIPDSVKSIGDSAFSLCRGIENMTIGNGVTIVGEDAFYNSYSLEVITFNGTKKQWNKITIENGNNPLLNANIIYLLQVLGDLDGDDEVTLEDAILLLQHSMFPEDYPIDYNSSVDFTKDGSIDIEDAILLLQHSMFPDDYPI